MASAQGGHLLGARPLEELQQAGLQTAASGVQSWAQALREGAGAGGATTAAALALPETPLQMALAAAAAVVARAT